MTLDFNPERHEYTFDGLVVPSVTQILKPLGSLAGIPAQVLEKARVRGEAVHKATEMEDVGEFNEWAYTHDIQGYVAAYRQFKADTGAEVLESEFPVYHRKKRYAGTLDRIMLIDGKTLVDLKATYAMPVSVGPQTAAYAEAYNYGKPAAEKVVARAALRLKKDGTYEYETHTSKADWQVFLSCLNVHSWLAAKGAIK